MKVSFGRDGIIAMTSSKTYAPVGFIRKVGADYTATIFKIENGWAQYSCATNNMEYAAATGTVITSKKRADIAEQVAEIYAASF